MIVPEKPLWGGNNKVCMYSQIWPSSPCMQIQLVIPAIEGWFEKNYGTTPQADDGAFTFGRLKSWLTVSSLLYFCVKAGLYGMICRADSIRTRIVHVF